MPTEDERRRKKSRVDERSVDKGSTTISGKEVRARSDRPHGVVAGAGNTERTRGNGPAYDNRSKAAQASNLRQSISDAPWPTVKEGGEMNNVDKLVST